jgi:hypothetical protein
MENADGFTKIKIHSSCYPVNDDLSFTKGQVPSFIEWIKDKPENAESKLRVFANESSYYAGDDTINYLFLIEPRPIMSNVYYDLIEKDMKSKFKYIFTHDADMLQLPNAKLLTWGGMYYGCPSGGGKLSPDAYLHKTKNISYLAGTKLYTPMHEVRYNLAKMLNKGSEVDCFGVFSPRPSYVKAAQTLTDYRYSIILENEINDEWFTEKIVNCFGAMTVPIYWGARNIGKYFNTDGIITVNSEEEIIDAINHCCESDYMSRLNAINDNYNRSMDYQCFEDIFYRMYKKEIEEDNR